MKRLLLCLSAIVLCAALASAQNSQGQNGDDQGQNGGRPHYSGAEPGAIAMLVLSASAIGGGLVVRRRKKD